jgi:hypothetical protein
MRLKEPLGRCGRPQNEPGGGLGDGSPESKELERGPFNGFERHSNPPMKNAYWGQQKHKQDNRLASPKLKNDFESSLFCYELVWYFVPTILLLILDSSFFLLVFHSTDSSRSEPNLSNRLTILAEASDGLGIISFFPEMTVFDAKHTREQF